MLPRLRHWESMRAGERLRLDVRSGHITSLIGVFDIALLERDMSRHHPAREAAGV